ncbi:MAG: hypothetical protein ACK5NG_06185 [Chthoniobacterales bacterium]
MSAKNICLLTITLAALTGVVIYSGLTGSGKRLTEADLRNVSEIEIQTKDIHRSGQNIRVDCELQNHGQRNAYSIVFTVSIKSEDGKLLGANPLGNILNLQPGASQSISIPVPVSEEPPEKIHAEAEVNLVRWDDAEGLD